jgi:bifunctional non-homologous end joining protein LigD
LTTRYPLIARAVELLALRSCLIDGEVIVCNGNGLADFDLLRGRQHDGEATLCTFDLLELNGRDLRQEPIEDRKRELTDLLRDCGPGLTINKVFIEPGDVVFKHACALGCEGIVSKRRGSRYRSGRSPDWLKFKSPEAPAVKREAKEEWQ